MTRVPDDVGPGDPLWAEHYNQVLACLRDLQRGPEVMAPLTKIDGVVMLLDQFRVYKARVVETIDGREGDQMGRGRAQIYQRDADGLLKPRLGFTEVEVWNDNGAEIPVGTRIKIMFVEGAWEIYNGDCSGVP